MVFVNHRSNIGAMTMRLSNIGELLAGVSGEDGELEPPGLTPCGFRLSAALVYAREEVR